MHSDLEAVSQLRTASWLSSTYRASAWFSHSLFERSIARARWIRICLLISLGYIILTLSRTTTVSWSVNVPDGLQGSHAPASIRPNPSPENKDEATLPTTLAAAEKPSPTTSEHPTLQTSSPVSSNPTFDIKPYLQAILDPRDTTLERQRCNDTISSRYNHLKAIPNGHDIPKLKYFFAIDLYECVTLLPSLIGGVVEAIRFLGPEYCALSIVEGRSQDGTAEVLQGLIPLLTDIGIKYTLQQNPTNPKEEGADRIARLAELRNQALSPLLSQSPSDLQDPIIVFPNDVSICVDDLLELVHQKVIQKADVACSMDWHLGGSIFYDEWIARDIYGEPFWEIAQDGEWRFAKNLFPNNRESKRRFEQRKPFQVYACWNGIAVLNSAPFFKDGIRFRGRKGDECVTGEPTYLAKDFWNANYTRIITVPAVGVANNLKDGRECKDNYGSTSYNVEQLQTEEQELITDWKPQPPYMVCAPSFTPRWWVSTR